MDLSALHALAPLDFETFATPDDIAACLARVGPIWNAEVAVLGALPVAGDVAVVPGFCVPCARDSMFETHVAPVRAETSWREGLSCRRCGMTQRQRAMIDAFGRLAGHRSGDAIYLTEQRSRPFRWFRRRYPNVIGSEFAGPHCRPGGAYGWFGRRVRHEDLTALSLRDASVQQVVSMDVLEHVPDYRTALRECARVLAPAGTLLLSVPFRIKHVATKVLAELLPDGRIVHHAPPEYHRDPRSPGGVLAYYRFGWDLLARLHEAGFARAGVVIWWDSRRGYLGVPQSMLVAHKAGARSG